MDIKHGTYAGYQKCRIINDMACDDCKRASREYMSNYRDTHPDSRNRAHRRDSLNKKALQILRDRHRSEYREIINQLKEKE